MVRAHCGGPGCREIAGDPGIMPAPGAMDDAADVRPEEGAGNEVELPEAHKNHGQDEKLEFEHVHHRQSTTFQNVPNRP